MPEPTRSVAPYIIAVANEKGGVGKTTTTLAIGSLLARKGYKILCIDLDPQGNLALSLGFKPHDMPTPNFALPTSGTFLASDSFRTENENLDLVFARSLIIAEDPRIKANTGDEDHFLSQDLMILKKLPYNYVIIDCPPSIGKIVINTLLVSDFLVIPTQAEYFSAFALKTMMQLVETVRRSGNPGLRYRTLITLFDKRNRVQHNLKNQLLEAFHSGMFETIIEIDAELRKTAILGFPGAHSRGVNHYQALVDELLNDIQTQQVEI